MSIDKLIIFKELAEVGHFTNLAKQKKIAVPTITRAIQALEEECGCRLINRSHGRNGNFELTERGKMLLASLPALLQLYNTTLSLVQTDSTQTSNINIYSTCAIIEDWLVPSLANFRKKFPKIKLNFIQKDQLMAPGKLQNVIAIGPHAKNSEGFVQVPLLDFHVRLWGSKKYFEKFGKPKRVSDLKKHQFLIFSGEMDTLTYLYANWHIRSFDIPQENISCINATNGIMRACEEGLGLISIAEETVISSDYDLEVILPKTTGPDLTMCFTYPDYWKDQPTLLALGEFFKQSFQALYQKRIKKSVK